MVDSIGCMGSCRDDTTMSICESEMGVGVICCDSRGRWCSGIYVYEIEV